MVFQRKGDKVFIVKLLIGNTETIMVIPVNVCGSGWGLLIRE